MQESSPKPPAGRKPVRKQSSGEGIKDTIESILIAFVLAFVFRAFIVEAFVIPSGSMAPTLLGAHMRFRCPDCGWQWDVNYNAGSPDATGVPDRTGMVLSVHCPNCYYKVPRSNGDDPNQSATNTPIRYGDRILVLKYLYLLEQPARWDVVVFKSPADTKGTKYNENYIKRLVGRPGEQVMFLDGDIYVCPANSDGPIEQRPWEVQHKPRAVQEALWRIVYNNDFHPLRKTWTQPWKKRANTEGWKFGANPVADRVFSFDNATGAGVLDFDKDANFVDDTHESYALTDWLAYSDTKDAFSRDAPPDQYGRMAYNDRNGVPRWYVSDLKLQFEYNRSSGDGPLRVSLSRLEHTFTAELADGKVQLIDSVAGVAKPVESAANLPAGPLKVEFSNVDYLVTVRVNGQDLVTHAYKPDMKDVFERHERRKATANPEMSRDAFSAPRISIAAEKQQCQISHLSLWRDVYYTPGYYYDYHDSRQMRGDRMWASPENPIALGSRAAGQAEDEYFVMGDNSILSSDARVWRDPINLPDEDLQIEAGRVPGRFMLGKAFFVYWPAGYRPFGTELPGLVPNFGDMRFIH